MARIYAGILGPLAMLTALMRGLWHGGGTEATLWTAWSCLWAFAAVGYALGWIAQRTIEEAVSQRVEAELAAQEARAEAAAAVPRGAEA